MKPIHNRMPAILSRDSYSLWLDPDEHQPAELMPLLTSYPDELMTAHPVSRTVNSPQNETPDCILPLAEM
jgi:putative SOS response-associated peptidase YedK